MKVLPDVDPMAGRIYERCAVVGNAGVLDSYRSPPPPLPFCPLQQPLPLSSLRFPCPFTSLSAPAFSCRFKPAGFSSVLFPSPTALTPALHAHRYGHAIDQHDAVFRFNVGPTVGYESKVGSKTTFRLVNTNHAGWHEKKEADIQQMQSMIGLLLYVKYRKAHRNAKLFAFDPAFSEYVSSNLKVRLPFMQSTKGRTGRKGVSDVVPSSSAGSPDWRVFRHMDVPSALHPGSRLWVPL